MLSFLMCKVKVLAIYVMCSRSYWQQKVAAYDPTMDVYDSAYYLLLLTLVDKYDLRHCFHVHVHVYLQICLYMYL